jgi:hypothetical protein
MFDGVPKKHRPRCSKRDKEGCCPKGVVDIHRKNSLVTDIVLFLSTNSRDSFNGLVKFDREVVFSFLALSKAEFVQEEVILSKVLFLVNAVNEHLLEKMDEEAKKEKDDRGRRNQDPLKY